MASASLEQSSSQTSSMTEHSRIRSDSLEQAEAQKTRKRPRLEGDDRASSERAITDSDSSGPDPQSTTMLPSSNVTINTRSPGPPPPDRPPQELDIVSEGTIQGDEDVAISNPTGNDDSAAHATSDVQAPISIASSPSPTQSPEIEVAELEDIDESSTGSKWKALEQSEPADSSRFLVQEKSYLESFPYAARSSDDTQRVITELAAAFCKGNSQGHDNKYFLEVKDWLEHFLSQHESLSLEAVNEDRLFWQDWPLLIDGLLKRRVDFTVTRRKNVLEEFLVAYAQLTLRFVQLDTKVLQRYDDQDPMSRNYLDMLTHVLQFTDIPFYVLLSSITGLNHVNMVAAVNDRIVLPPIGAIEHLMTFAQQLIKDLPQRPALAPVFVAASSVVHFLTKSGAERRHVDGDDMLLTSPAIAVTNKLAYSFITIVDEAFQTAISKQSSWLTIENSADILRNISGTYHYIAETDLDWAANIMQTFDIVAPEAEPTQYSELITFAWKFRVLKKYITTGRMELRVHGMETMQNDLVHLWKTHIQFCPGGVELPTVQYMVKFLRENKLVEYIVGVDSHPQLISRSGNVVGFLVVTSTYTDDDTDIIWRTVTESLDPRTVAEVLRMLETTFNMHPLKSLVYLCEKLINMPLSRLDGKMLEYTGRLMNAIRLKNHNDHGRTEPLPAVVFQLCVRIIREVSSSRDLSPENRTSLQLWATRQLSEMLCSPIGDEDKHTMWQECVQDVAEKNAYATGSLQAMNVVFERAEAHEIWKLASEFDFTRLLIEEIAAATEHDAYYSDTSFSENGLATRLSILQRLIHAIPESITPELSDMLWARLYGSESLGDQARSLTWEYLSAVMQHLITPNPFIERLVNDYLPRLPPEMLSSQVLAFVSTTIEYDVRFNPPPQGLEDETITIPGVDRVWRFILTAPHGPVVSEATNYVIKLYLDHPLISRQPRKAVEATHVFLVDHCVEQLTSAAAKLKTFNDGSMSGDDEPMIIIASEEEVRAEELRFSRSLQFLRQFLQGLKARPQYSPPRPKAPEICERKFETQGDEISVSYQAFGGNRKNPPIETLRIGDLNTAAELADYIGDVTGFLQYTTIVGGQRIDLSGNSSNLRELKIGKSGMIIVRQVPGSRDKNVTGRRQSLTLVDSEVIKHFDELYDLLDLEERLSKEIFEFLSVFPPQPRVQELVRSPDASEVDAFPLDKPYKHLYSLNAMQICLEDVVLAQTEDEEFISHSVRILVSTLTRPQSSETPLDQRLRFIIANTTVGCLFLALKAKVSSDTSRTYFSDHSSLVRRLIELINTVHLSQTQHFEGVSVRLLLKTSLATLLEASLHDEQIMVSIKENEDLGTFLLMLLLQEDRADFRQAAVEVITRISGPPPSSKISMKAHTTKTSALDSNLVASRHLLSELWTAMLPSLGKASKKPATSEELFTVALAILQALGKSSIEGLDLNAYLQNWGDILLNYEHNELVGRDSEDFFVSGLCKLMKLCLHIARASGIQLESGHLMIDVFNHLLFPELSPASTSKEILPRAPIQTSTTRQEIYDIILSLCQDPERYNQILDSLDDLIPRGGFLPQWTLGVTIAQQTEDYLYDSNWTFDREKTILSPIGYAGLRNLSNTCYFNSLMTQLFMNVEFRDFVLQANVADGKASQRLLAETQKVFAYMQDTWLKAVDPQGMVDSISTYEGESIDVNIQMDVDEFYNLLFDRWEGQVLSSDEKKKFRSFYGGQLVQQIKSKECPHISERLEPFSAIQCEIKGKRGLEESLRAYVEGEVMQGDNKYSCTSCGRHVDAMKRACLKDIPNHLIFHLKRFDFDIQTMMRSKINDEFQFPHRIDMAPYTVEALNDENESVAPDVFELVGILVHSGTAESGHYWSYIRERPTKNSFQDSWIEFNDSNVSAFEPSKIADQCFGGSDSIVPGFMKIHNAYMLFYQRVPSMEEVQTTYKADIVGELVKLSLPLETGNRIAMENELYIRSYCAQDPRHAAFVRALLERMQWEGNRRCSADHDIEDKALGVALQYMEQVLTRSKELPEFDATIRAIAAYINHCDKCAKCVFEWIRKWPDGVRNLLCRNPQQVVRINFGDLAALCLTCLRKAAQSAGSDEVNTYRQQVTRLVKILYNLWKDMHLYSRAWDQYFDLLGRIVSLGRTELNIILDHHFLEYCLEIIWLDGPDIQRLHKKHINFLRLRDKGRTYNMTNLYTLLAYIIEGLDLTGSQTVDEDEDSSVTPPLQLNDCEEELLYSTGHGRVLECLDRMISSQWNSAATIKIVTHMLKAEPDAGHLAAIQNTLIEGVRKEPATRAIPFLDHVLLFCQFAPNGNILSDMIDHTVNCFDTLEGVAGKEHMKFIQSLAQANNDRLRRPPKWFYKKLQLLVGEWAPVLLIYRDRQVREDCFIQVKEMIFDLAGDDRRPESTRDAAKQHAKVLSDACLEKLKKSFLVRSENDTIPAIDHNLIFRVNEIVSFVAESFLGESEEDQALLQKTTAIMERIKQIAVEIPEDYQSDWDNESLMVSDSDGAGNMSP